jgi:hypothetical protein
VANTKLLVFTAFVGALALWSCPARASSIASFSLPGCDTTTGGCPAATYSFNITATSATLTIHITGPVTGTNNEITGVDLGFTPSNNFLGLITVTGPNAGWFASSGSLNNGGCGPNMGAFICASGLVHISQGGTYTWTWNYTLKHPTNIAPSGSVHTGANYGPASGLIVSQTGTPTTPTVPEPSVLALTGTGLLALGGFFRRKIGR